MPTKDKLVFVDIETTGDDYVNDFMIEFAMVIADRESLDIIDEFDAIVETDIDPMLQVRVPVVMKMHLDNDLLRKGVNSVIRYMPAYIERQAIMLMHRNHALSSPMAGHSVHFDRTFLLRDMPALHAMFHYRNFDLSSIKQFWLDAYPKGHSWWDGFPENNDRHRALYDCRVAVSELLWFRDKMEEISETSWVA